jgi:hypothetical protein
MGPRPTLDKAHRRQYPVWKVTAKTLIANYDFPYKGRPSAKAIEKDFPHIVEMRLPLGGFGKTLDAMHEWHTKRVGVAL